MQWSLVIPVKLLATAKTRLGLPPAARADLALAMAADVLAAGLAAPAVARAIVVTDDPRARQALAELGAIVVADEPDAGLNPALEHAAQRAWEIAPLDGVAAISSDVPLLSASELGRALELAADSARGFVSDKEGTGTTLLCAQPGGDLAPRFGAGSALLHETSGAVRLQLAAPGLQTDVDTLEDLRALLKGDSALAVRTRRAAQALGLAAAD